MPFVTLNSTNNYDTLFYVTINIDLELMINEVEFSHPYKEGMWEFKRGTFPKTSNSLSMVIP
jgi:hypothetical protein